MHAVNILIHSLTPVLILSSYLCIGLPSGFFISGFTDKILYM
jgi:hypothetical protein